VLIVDDGGSLFSPPCLAFVFGTSAGVGAVCADKEEPEALLLFFDRFFFDLGNVVTARIERKKKQYQSIISIILLLRNARTRQ